MESAGVLRRRAWFLVWLFVAFTLLTQIVLVTLRVGFDIRPSATARFCAEGLVAAAVIIGLLSRWGWWRRAGFRRPDHWRSLWLMWMPLLYLAVLAPGPIERRGWEIAALIAAAVITGFVEEAYTRGLLLEALRPAGARRAVLLSATFFGAGHLVNLLVGKPAMATVLQVGYATAIGIALGALRLRLGTIWPLIAFHAVFNTLGGLHSEDSDITTSSLSSLRDFVFTLAAFVPLAIHGLILLRSGDDESPSQSRRDTELPGVTPHRHDEHQE